MRTDPAKLLREARLLANLTQRQLAARAETSQSVIARIERGQTSPSWETLARLVDAAGFDLAVDLEVKPPTGSHMLDDVARILAFTPEDRLAELANVSRLTVGATRVQARAARSRVRTG